MSNKTLMILGAAGILLGSFLPWATVRSTFPAMELTVTGLDGDGLFSIPLGIVLLLAGLLKNPPPGKNAGALTIIVGFIAAFFAIFELINILTELGTSFSGITTSLGAGVPVMLIGALVFLIGAGQNTPEAPAPIVAATPPAETAP
jgi:hypothetical protein